MVEGKKKYECCSNSGIESLRENVITVLVILNDKGYGKIYGKLGDPVLLSASR